MIKIEKKFIYYISKDEKTDEIPRKRINFAK